MARRGLFFHLCNPSPHLPSFLLDCRSLSTRLAADAKTSSRKVCHGEGEKKLANQILKSCIVHFPWHTHTNTHTHTHTHTHKHTHRTYTQTHTQAPQGIKILLKVLSSSPKVGSHFLFLYMDSYLSGGKEYSPKVETMGRCISCPLTEVKSNACEYRYSIAQICMNLWHNHSGFWCLDITISQYTGACLQKFW